MNGYVKLHRKIREWEWWEDHNTTRLWIYILARANFKATRWKGTNLKAGDFVTSIRKLSENTGLSASEVRTALGKLKRTGEVTTEPRNKDSILTVCKWETYQADEREFGKLDGSQMGKLVASKGQGRGKQMTTDEEGEEYIEREEVGAGTEQQPLGSRFFALWSQSGMAKVFGDSMATPGKKEAIHRLADWLEKNGQSLEGYFEKCLAADWLRKSDNPERGKFGLSWFLDVENAAKVLEGRYDEVIDFEKARAQTGQHGFEDTSEADIAAKYGDS